MKRHGRYEPSHARGRGRLVRKVHRERARLVARAIERDARKEMVSARRAERNAVTAQVYGVSSAYLARWWNQQATFPAFMDAAEHLATQGGGIVPAGASVALVAYRKGKPACVVSRWLADSAGAWVPV